MNKEAIDKGIAKAVPEAVKRKSTSVPNSSTRASPKAPLSPLRDEDKLVPHYLRASTGSCHDLCKYGIKHDHEPKKLNPNFRRTSNKEKLSVEQKQVLDAIPNESKKKTDHKQRKIREVQTAEKLILDSLVTGIKESDQRSSSLNPEFPSLASNPSFDNSSINENEEPSDDISVIQSGNANASSKIDPEDRSEGLTSEPANSVLGVENLLSGFGFQEHPDGTQIDGYSQGPTNELVISTPIEQNTGTSSNKGINVEGSSTPQENTEMIADASIPRRKVNGVEVPSNKMIENKSKIPKAPRAETSLKSKNNQSPTSSVKGSSTKQGEKTVNGSPRIKLKAPPSTQVGKPPSGKTRTGRTDGTPVEKCQEKSFTTNHKAKGEVNKLKVADKKIGASANAEVIKQGNIDLVERSSSVQKNASKRKTIKSAKLVSEQKDASFTDLVASVAPKVTKNTKNTDVSAIPKVTKKSAMMPPNKVNASVKPRVIKRQTSISLRTTNASIKTATPVKLKKLMVNSSFTSIPSGEKRIQRNKSKIISNKDEEMMSSAQSNKTHLRTVPSLKLGRTKSVTSASKVKFGLKEKSSSITSTNIGKIDLKAARERLRKLRLYSFDKRDENETSGSKWNQVKKYVMRKDVSERNLSVVINGEIKRRHRRTASLLSLDKMISSRKLNFNRGKVINPEPRDNTPVKLKFRRPTRLPSSSSLIRRSLFGSTSKDPNSRKPEAQAVVLRHQELQDKKEVQVLFNNVIEETANKLVGTKKSKVKALVGAFETIIAKLH